MAYDEELTNRLRAALEGLETISEKRMMGGVCFLLNGNMLCGADRTKAGEGRFMFRVGKNNEAEALSRPGSQIMEMGGKRMGGLIFAEEAACNPEAIKAWISLALDFVAALPAK